MCNECSYLTCIRRLRVQALSASPNLPTAGMAYEAVSCDVGKQLKGRKRFTLGDTFGSLLAVHIVAASIAERGEANSCFIRFKQSGIAFPA